MRMNPQQPGNNPYDFILSPPKAPAPKVYLPGGNGKGARIALALGGIFFLIIVVWIVAALFSKPDPNKTQMVSLAETQQEVVRVVTTGGLQANNQGLKNSSVTIELTVQSHQNQTIAYLKTQNVKVSLKQLALKKSAATDAKLKTATENSAFDQAYGPVIQQELKDYASELKTAYNTATGSKAKALIKNEFADTQKLLSQLSSNLPTASDTSASSVSP